MLTAKMKHAYALLTPTPSTTYLHLKRFSQPSQREFRGAIGSVAEDAELTGLRTDEHHPPTRASRLHAADRSLGHVHAPHAVHVHDFLAMVLYS